MRTRFALAGFAAAALALAQAPTQTVLQFAQTESVQDFQEMANAIRTIADVPGASTDNAKKTLSLAGSAEQIALASWMFAQLDQTAPPQTPDPSFTAGTNDTARIFYLSGIATVQEFQEIANATRTITQVRRAFTVNAQRAVVMRGTPDQIALAAWIVSNLNHSSPAPADQYSVAADDVVKMFKLTHAAGVQDFQEIASMVRTIGSIRFAFTVNPQFALAVRGTPDQIALASWLASELDRHATAPAAPAAGPHEYRAGADDLVRVFYLTGAASVEDFQKAATQVRTASGVRQAFTEVPQRALAIRGTASQMQISENTLKALGL